MPKRATIKPKEEEVKKEVKKPKDIDKVTGKSLNVMGTIKAPKGEIGLTNEK